MKIARLLQRRDGGDAVAEWRDARDCVLEAHADFYAAPPAEQPRRLACLVGALEVEQAARTRAFEALA